MWEFAAKELTVLANVMTATRSGDTPLRSVILWKMGSKARVLQNSRYIRRYQNETEQQPN